MCDKLLSFLLSPINTDILDIFCLVFLFYCLTARTGKRNWPKMTENQHLNITDQKFQEIASAKNVIGVIVLNLDGAPIKTSLDQQNTNTYSELAYNLIKQTRDLIQVADATNDTKFMRLTTKRNEIMICPDVQYTLVVIQHIQDEHNK